MESTFGTYCLDVSVCKYSEDGELNEFREFRNCARTLFGVSTKLFNFTKFPNNFEFCLLLYYQFAQVATIEPANHARGH